MPGVMQIGEDTERQENRYEKKKFMEDCCSCLYWNRSDGTSRFSCIRIYRYLKTRKCGKVQ